MSWMRREVDKDVVWYQRTVRVNQRWRGDMRKHWMNSELLSGDAVCASGKLSTRSRSKAQAWTELDVISTNEFRIVGGCGTVAPGDTYGVSMLGTAPGHVRDSVQLQAGRDASSKRTQACTCLAFVWQAMVAARRYDAAVKPSCASTWTGEAISETRRGVWKARRLEIHCGEEETFARGCSSDSRSHTTSYDFGLASRDRRLPADTIWNPLAPSIIWGR